jgi:hypothetical protein
MLRTLEVMNGVIVQDPDDVRREGPAQDHK